MSDKSHICLLGLIILCSHLTGVTGVAHVFSSSGENVSLVCINALSDCTSTTWNYNKHRTLFIVELINGGIKKNNIERAERLSLGSDCSLNIYKTTKDDHGQYTCQQYVNGHKPVNDAQVFLHVLHVSPSSTQTVMRSGSSVTLTCQLFSYEDYCNSWIHSESLQLSWVNEADVNLLIDSKDQISAPGPCIIILNTILLNEDNNREWRCLIKMKNEIKTSASYTVKFTDPAITTANPKIASETEGSTTRVLLYRVIIVIVEIIAFTVPTVILLLIICTERAENSRRTQTT